MSKILDPSKFGDILYNSLPPIYRVEDRDVNFALKRYLQALSEGGFSYVLEEINGLLDLNDPDRTPSNVIPILFEQYGLEVFNGLPDVFLRKLLPLIGDLYARKGSITSIEFITSVISNVKAEVQVSPNFLEDHSIDLRLEMDFDRQFTRDIPDKEQLYRVIKEFIPFFIKTTVIYVYLFYEIGNIRGIDETAKCHLINTFNEQVLLISDKGTRYYPLTNNQYSTLNGSFFLNDTVHCNEDIDPFVDSIIQTMFELGKLRKDTDILHESHVSLKALHDLCYVSMVEKYNSKVQYSPVEDIQSLYSIGKPHIGNSVFQFGTPFNEAIFGEDRFDTLTDHHIDTITSRYSDGIGIRADKTNEGFFNSIGLPNRVTNETLITNEGLPVDSFEDKITIDDSAKTTGSDPHIRYRAVMGSFRYHASLNTGMTLNNDFITNESHTCYGHITNKEKSLEEVSTVYQDRTSVTQTEKQVTTLFTNMNQCVINNAHLNNMDSYDKITKNGVVTFMYLTPFGCIKA